MYIVFKCKYPGAVVSNHTSPLLNRTSHILVPVYNNSKYDPTTLPRCLYSSAMRRDWNHWLADINTRKRHKVEHRRHMTEKERSERNNEATVIISSTSEEPEVTPSIDEVASRYRAGPTQINDCMATILLISYRYVRP